MTAPIVPLTGADCFLRAFDAETRRFSGAGHLSQLVLRLGPGFEPERLREVLAKAAELAPILRAPVRRRRGIGAPVYRVDRASRAPLPAVTVHEPAGEPMRDDGGAGHGAFARRLNDRFDLRGGRILTADVVPHAQGGGSDLALTWVHLLFDGAGSEGFVRWLDALGSGGDAALPGGDGLGDTAPAPLGAGRGRQAQAWQRHMASFAGRPPRSLAGPLCRAPQQLGWDLQRFSAGETAQIAERAVAKAGFLTPMLFYLAAAIRGHDAVFRARGEDPGSFVVPLPVNVRPRGGEGAVFRTHVSMLWFQVPAEVARDLDGLVEHLKTQRRDSIKAKLVEAGSAAMDYARYAPAPLYAKMARRSFGGELCSFFFAYTDQFLPGLSSFLGAPVENGFHVPSVPASPGSSAVLSIREGRLNLTHVHQQGVFRAGERELLRDRIAADLLGRGVD